ncbi:MAG: hypothetical protein Marn2KO_22190 [Marinobacter nauticus]
MGSITIPSRIVIASPGTVGKKTRTGQQSEPVIKCYAERSDGIVPEPRMHPEKSADKSVMAAAEVHLVTN